MKKKLMKKLLRWVEIMTTQLVIYGSDNEDSKFATKKMVCYWQWATR